MRQWWCRRKFANLAAESAFAPCPARVEQGLCCCTGDLYEDKRLWLHRHDCIASLLGEKTIAQTQWLWLLKCKCWDNSIVILCRTAALLQDIFLLLLLAASLKRLIRSCLHQSHTMAFKLVGRFNTIFSMLKVKTTFLMQHSHCNSLHTKAIMAFRIVGPILVWARAM